ncbi:carboxypeptidase regulatory-like domain-containing protein [Gimesia sp.]|uniref:carboxypeptidase regulatory-like domain-containing protein n=1 Tax=Gimesia sp. TaxID=2024833 RepID=UPI003A938982
MWWLNETGAWLVHSTVFGAIILFLGAVAIWLCREPVYRIRLIHWTFVACLLVPLLQQRNIIPRYSLNLWQEAGSITETQVDHPPSQNHQIPSAATEVALQEPRPRFETATSTNTVSPPPSRSANAAQKETRAANEIDLFSILFRTLQIIYLTIVGFFLLRTAVGFTRLWFITRAAQSAPVELCDLFAAVTGTPAPAVRLLVSSQVRTPVMWGLWRPTIVIPAELLTKSNQAELRWCLAHEWSHVLRRDFGTLLLANLVKLLCFYQPAYWWLRRRLILNQDFLADAFAAQQGESTEDYAAFLVSLARAKHQPKLAGTLGIRDRRSQLLQRVSMLVKSTQPLLLNYRRLPAFAIIVSVLLIAGGLSVLRLGAAPPDEKNTVSETNTAAQTEKQPEATPTRDNSNSKPQDKKQKTLPDPVTYTGIVVDRFTGEPIPDATVEISRQLSQDPATGGWSTIRTTTHKTDQNGNYRFTLPPEEVAEHYLYIEVDAHHPQYQSLGRQGYGYIMILKNLKNGAPPFFSKLKLIPGKEISAVVQQPDGTPAANIRVLVYSKRPPPDEKKLHYEFGAFQTTWTDQDGRFRMTVATPGDGVVWAFSKKFSPLAHRLGDQRGDLGILKLEAGTRLRGQVLDLDGKPVPDVAVNLRRNGDGKEADEFLQANAVANAITAGTKTDKKGRFELNPLPPGKYKAVVDEQVEDYTEDPERAATLKLDHTFIPLEVTIAEGQPHEPILFKEVPSVIVRGRFFNSKGEPRASHKQHITGRINGQFIFRTSTLPKNDGWFEFKVPRGLEQTDIQFMTNEHGALLWRLKPEDPLHFGYIAELGTLNEDLTTLEIVRFTAPILLLKAVDEQGNLIREFKISSKYTSLPKPEKRLLYANGGDVDFEAQEDGRWRSSQLLPDRELSISIEKQGFTTEPQTVKLKEGEVRNIEFVLKKTE